MDKYKELFYKSQAGMADAIDNLEEILYELKVCMIECEEQVISDNNTEIRVITENEACDRFSQK